MQSHKRGEEASHSLRLRLEVNMQSNYISLHFNYEATPEWEKQRKGDGQKHVELDVTAYKLNI